MSDRVVSSGEGRQAIQRMQSIINGPLVEQINALNTEAQKLCDPNNFDGRHAQQFRGRWPEMNQKLMAAKTAVEELRQQVKSINDAIQTAGGNG